jgi:hypothetical protein
MQAIFLSNANERSEKKCSDFIFVGSLMEDHFRQQGPRPSEFGGIIAAPAGGN